MCLDNKKLSCLDTDMATYPWMYSRTQKSNIKENYQLPILQISWFDAESHWTSLTAARSSVVANS